MISTGINYLDKITGGFKLGDNIVWQVSDGVPVEIFIHSFFSNTDNFNNSIIYVNFNYSPQTIYNKYDHLFKNFNTILVDAFTHGKGKSDQVFLNFYKKNNKNNKMICVDEPGNIKSFTSILNEIENENQDGAFYIFDSLTGMNELWKDETAVLDFFSFTCPKLYDLNTLAYWVYEKNAHSKEFIASLTHITQIVFALAKAHSNNFEFRIKKLEGRHSYYEIKPSFFRIIDNKVQFQEKKSDILLNIGHKIKELRRIKKVTQTELAGLLKLTPGAVSQIENDIITPSLQTLVQLSSTFGKPLEYFINTDLNENENKGYSILKNRHQITSPSRNATILKLFEDDDFIIKPYSVTISKGKTVNGPLIYHKGVEFLNIIRGSLYITLEGEVHYLKEGDSVTMKTSFIQKIQNKGNSHCHFIYILS